MADVSLVQLPSDKCYWTSTIIWLNIGSGDGSVPLGKKTIIWADVDPDLRQYMVSPGHYVLSHWGRVTHICLSKLTIIASDNGLSPGPRQAIVCTNAGKLLIGPLGTNFNEMLIKIITFSFMKMRLKVSSAKWRPFCLGLNVF